MRNFDEALKAQNITFLGVAEQIDSVKRSVASLEPDQFSTATEYQSAINSQLKAVSEQSIQNRILSSDSNDLCAYVLDEIKRAGMSGVERVEYDGEFHAIDGMKRSPINVKSETSSSLMQELKSNRELMLNKLSTLNNQVASQLNVIAMDNTCKKIAESWEEIDLGDYIGANLDGEQLRAFKEPVELPSVKKFVDMDLDLPEFLKDLAERESLYTLMIQHEVDVNGSEIRLLLKSESSIFKNNPVQDLGLFVTDTIEVSSVDGVISVRPVRSFDHDPLNQGYAKFCLSKLDERSREYQYASKIITEKSASNFTKDLSLDVASMTKKQFGIANWSLSPASSASVKQHESLMKSFFSSKWSSKVANVSLDSKSDVSLENSMEM